MRQTIRAALKRGRTRVAVVCGAWHAPVLTAPLGPAAPDARLLRGLPKRKVVCTWVPWTHRRLAAASGYGAGITSPGWYAHLFEAPDVPVTRWLTAVAGELRGRDLPVSSASVIEAVRLAETLASLRGRPLAGLTEVTDATRAVLCDGDELALRFVTDRLVVGERLGDVPASVPTVPLEADLAATTRRLRLKREPAARSLDLDLRRGIDRERSQLFHRLRLLELAWAAPATSDVQATGTFRETWRLAWQPELADRRRRGGGLGHHRRVRGDRPGGVGGRRAEPGRAGPHGRALPPRRAPGRPRAAAGGLRRPGRARRRRRAPDGGRARAGPGRALRRRPRHRHREPAGDRGGAGAADLRRARAGDDRARRRERRPGARPRRRRARGGRAAGAGGGRRGPAGVAGHAAGAGRPARPRPAAAGPAHPAAGRRRARRRRARSGCTGRSRTAARRR